MTNISRISAVLLAVTLAACAANDADVQPPADEPDDTTEPEPKPEPEPAPEPEPEPLTGPLDFTGVYDLQSEWDLSGAIAADSLGDLVADLLIEQVVAGLGLPGFLQDDARDALSSIAHDPIADFIDANTSDVLDPSTGVLADLAEILGQVHVIGELELTDADGDLARATGVKRITAVRIALDGNEVDVPIELLTAVLGGTSIEADVAANVIGRDQLVFESHELVMRTDPLVALGLSELLSIDDLEQFAIDALDCGAAIEALTGGASLTINLGFQQNVTISASALVSGCEAVRGEALDQLIGMFEMDLGIEISGPSVMVDAPADLTVDRIEAVEGHSGVLSSLPAALQSEFAIAFTATRQ